MYVHINIWLRPVTYIATTIYMKKSYALKIKNIYCQIIIIVGKTNQDGF